MTDAAKSPNVVWHASGVAREERWAASAVQGVTVWLTGLSGSGKSTIAGLVEQQLVDAGVLTEEIEARLAAEIKAAVDDATDYAEGQPDPDPATATRYVYHDEPGETS